MYTEVQASYNKTSSYTKAECTLRYRLVIIKPVIIQRQGGFFFGGGEFFSSSFLYTKIAKNCKIWISSEIPVFAWIRLIIKYTSESGYEPQCQIVKLSNYQKLLFTYIKWYFITKPLTGFIQEESSVFYIAMLIFLYILTSKMFRTLISNLFSNQI